MDLDLSDDEAAIVELFASFFTRECTPAVVRAAESLGHDPELWKRLHEMGAPALAVGPGSGGGGGSLLDAVLVAEQAGRVLAPVPFAEHLVALRLLERLGDEADPGAPAPDDAAPSAPSPPARRVAGIVASGAPITLALRPAGEVARLVPFGAVADSVIAWHGDELVRSTSPPPGAARANGSGLAIADRSLHGAVTLASGPDALAAYSHAVDEWRLLTAAALVGLAGRALDLGVAYVSERHQFGVPIGTFQAIQHGLAEFPGPLNGARLLVARTAWRAVHEPDRFGVGAAMALHFATELARAVTARVLHYHGGYGVMEEYDIQLYHRRARGWPAQLGDPAAELLGVADRLYGPGAT